MQIKASWSEAIPLTKSKELIYDVDLDLLPRRQGVYLFGRMHGETVVPIYIGKSKSIRGRIPNHLKSLPLMKEILNARTGSRFLIYCLVKTKSPKKAEKQIDIIERALIMHAQNEGHVLFNTQGTKLPTDEISFTGNRVSEAIAPRVMLIKRTPSKTKSAGKGKKRKKK